VASYPAALRPQLRRFLEATALCREGGVRVPAVLAVDEEAGLALLEDLGPATLWEQAGRGWSDLAPFYLAAIAAARRIAALPVAAVDALGSPPLDEALLSRELEATFSLLLVPSGLVVGEAGEERARRVLAEVCRRLGETPPVPCHRDFMVRNLLPAGGGEETDVAVIDHQDLRLGPPWYDLASLLNDSLFPPPELAEAWLDAAGWRPGPAVDYHRAAAQRCLKAAGTFASFAARGEPRHLPLVPAALGRALAHLERTPEGADLAAELAPRWRRELAGGLC
jgi:aminoglycoside/choline kinase family phosphotransferase